jgi:hypothetical protein
VRCTNPLDYIPRDARATDTGIVVTLPNLTAKQIHPIINFALVVTIAGHLMKQRVFNPANFAAAGALAPVDNPHLENPRTLKICQQAIRSAAAKRWPARNCVTADRRKVSK